MSGNAALRQFLPMVCLLAVAAAGAVARTTLPGRSVDISLTTPLTVTIAAAWTVGAVLIVSALLRSISWGRRRRPEYQRQLVEIPVSRFARAVAVTACLTLLIAPAVLLVAAARHHPGVHAMPSTPIASTTSHPRHAPAPRSGAPGPSRIELVGLAVAAVAAAGAATAIRRRQRDHHDGVGALPPDGLEESTAEAVAEVVRRGGQAMIGVTDPRMAIVACYAAMETEVADTGLSRDRAQTPSELLHATVHNGIVASEPAARLTRLFERARFGDDPMTHNDRLAAEDALAHLDPQRHPHRVRP